MTDASAAPGEGRLARWLHRDHTRGRLLVSMLVLSLPLVASNFVGGALFQIVDLGYLSRLGEDALTAVVVTNQSLRQVLFMLVMGASFGAQGLIARAVGSGDGDAADHVAGQLVILGLGCSALFAIAGVLWPAELLGWMKVSPAVLEEGVPYVRLTLGLSFGFVFLFLFNAVLGGAGDSTTPLLVTLVQTAVSLAAEWVLIFGELGAPALGVRGVALGLAVGQAAAGALALAVLFRGTSRVHLRWHHLVPDAAVLRRIGVLAWPPAVQLVGNFLVSIAFIRLMGEMGAKAQAAYSIGLRVSMLGPMIAFPLAGAAATLVGQNLGAGRVDRAWRSVALGLAANVALLWSIGGAMAWFRHEIVSLLSDDPEVRRLAAEWLLFQAGSFAAWAFYFVFFRALQGAGDVGVPMGISMGTALVVTLPLGLGLSGPLGWGPTGVFTATLAGSLVNTAVTGAWFATGRWTRRAP